RFGQRMFRRVPGGLAVATIFACAAFGAVSGSSVATVASIGRVAIQEMRKLGYRISVAAGAVSVSGTRRVMIPPSLALGLYGIVTGESIGELLIAAIVPGVITAAAYILVVIVRALLRPAAFRPAPVAAAAGSGTTPVPVAGGATPAAGEVATSSPSGSGATAAPAPRASGTAPLPAFRYRSLVETVILVVIVMGGIYTGLATVVEAASLGAVVALCMLLLRRPEASTRLRKLRNALLETTQLNAMIFLLLV